VILIIVFIILQKIMWHQLYFINKYKNSGGYVGLMSVIILSAMGSMITVAILVVGMARSRTSLDIEQQYRGEALSYACVNWALNKVYLDGAYMGNEYLDFDIGSCGIISVDKVDNTYTINTEGVVGYIVRKAKVVVVRSEDIDTLVVTMTVESWREVAEF
jgi:hypothetical protein